VWVIAVDVFGRRWWKCVGVAVGDLLLWELLWVEAVVVFVMIMIVQLAVFVLIMIIILLRRSF
jgi:hypothetical protein